MNMSFTSASGSTNQTADMPASRFYALDAIRGIAAIAVLFYHYTQHNGLNWLHNAWVAVDIFFILSGFVLMHSYGKKFLRGMTFNEFLFSRVARLGPMYVVGLLLGICAAVFSIFIKSDNIIQPGSVIKAAVLNAVLLPYFNNQVWPFGDGHISATVFPLNSPAWSLFFEIFVNIAFFICIARIKKINLRALVIISAAVFASITICFHQINPGAQSNNFMFGFPRVMFEFFLGVAIYKVYGHYKLPYKIIAYVLFSFVTLCFFSSSGAIGLINAFILAPLLVAGFAKITVPVTATHICKFLGDISYPLYITHFPLYMLLYELNFIRALTPIFQTCVFAIIAIIFAIVLVKIDEAVRNAIKSSSQTSLQNIQELPSN